jgi:hypothetical protein
VVSQLSSPATVLPNRSIVTDPQQQEAASRRMLWSGHLQRYVS